MDGDCKMNNNEKKNLFQLGDFKLHSGEKSDYKIDCDNLTDDDLETLAWIVAKKWKVEYNGVRGIDRGGNRFAKKLREYQKDWDIGMKNILLIVDDVLTTGNSMEEMRKMWKDNPNIEMKGVVIFSRGECPDWVRPVFRMEYR